MSSSKNEEFARTFEELGKDDQKLFEYLFKNDKVLPLTILYAFPQLKLLIFRNPLCIFVFGTIIKP